MASSDRGHTSSRARTSYRQYDPRRSSKKYDFSAKKYKGQRMGDGFDHWAHSLDQRPSSLPFFDDPAFFPLREALKEIATASKSNSYVREALAEAADHVWHCYKEVSHLSRFSIDERLSIGRRLVSIARRIRARSDLTGAIIDEGYVLADYIGAISRDCHFFQELSDPAIKSKDLPQSRRGSEQEQRAKAARHFELINLRAQGRALRGEEGVARDLITPLLTERKKIMMDALQDGTRQVRQALGDSESKQLSETLFAIFDAMLVADHSARRHNPDAHAAAERCLHWLMKVPQAFAIVGSYQTVNRRFAQLFSSVPDPIALMDKLLGRRDWSSFESSQAASFIVLAFAKSAAPMTAIDVYTHASTRGATFSDSVLKRLLISTAYQANPGITEALIKRIYQNARKDAKGGRRSDPQLSRSLLGTIAMFWAREGQAKKMEDFLKEIQERSPDDAYLKRLCEIARVECAASLGDVQSCLEQLERLRNPESTHSEEVRPISDRMFYATILKACNNRDDAETAYKYWDQMMANEYVPDILMCNSYMELFSRRGDVDSAMQLIETMRDLNVQPDKYTFTMLVHAFSLRKDAEGAVYATKALIAEGLTPDRVTYNALMNAYVQSSAWDAAIGIFRWMQNSRDVSIRPNIVTYNTLLKVYVARSLPVQTVLEAAAELRKAGIEWDRHTYSLMLQSASDAGMMDLAEELFTEVERRLPSPPGLPEGKGANLFHFTIMIHGYLRQRDNRQAKEYFDELRERGIEPSPITWATVISSYAKSDSETNFQLAKSLVTQLVMDRKESLLHRNKWRAPAVKQGAAAEIYFLPLLTTYGRRSEPDKAEEAIDELLSTDSNLSIPLLSTLLDAYRRSGEVEKGLTLFEKLYEQALSETNLDFSRLFRDSPEEDKLEADPVGSNLDGRQIEPARRNMLCIPMSMIIDLLSTTNRHDDIVRLWTKAKADGFAFDSHNWNHLAAAMARAGYLEEALTVVEQVLNQPAPDYYQNREYDTSRNEAGIELPSVGSKEDPYPQELDPLSMEGFYPAHLFKGKDLTISPVAPPNRRHQHRPRDERFASLPFESAPPVESELDMLIDEAEVRRSSEPSDLTYDLLEHREAELRFSPWYAHFETLTTINQVLMDVQSTGPAGADNVKILLSRFRRAAVALAAHLRKVEEIELGRR